MRFASLFSWIFVLLKFIKRCICRRKKIEDVDDNINLPSGVLISPSTQKSEEDGLTPWDNWGKNESELVSIKVEGSSRDEESTRVPQAEELDLFGDMQPVFQKPKKILLKSRSAESNNFHQPSDRLKFNSSVSLPETELGTWTEEDDAWNEVSDKEIEWETQNVLKEKRMAEREKRALEQQRKKEERDAARLAKKTAGNLGVRIS